MRALAFVFLVGCGGAVSSPLDDAGADDATTEGSAKDSAIVDVSTKDNNTTVDCAALQMKIDARRQELKVCCPICGVAQCWKVVQDVCCPFSATATDTAQFEADVAKYKQFCKPICPGAPCPSVPSNKCQPGGTMSQGTCL